MTDGSGLRRSGLDIAAPPVWLGPVVVAGYGPAADGGWTGW